MTSTYSQHCIQPGGQKRLRNCQGVSVLRLKYQSCETHLNKDFPALDSKSGERTFV